MIEEINQQMWDLAVALKKFLRQQSKQLNDLVADFIQDAFDHKYYLLQIKFIETNNIKLNKNAI